MTIEIVEFRCPTCGHQLGEKEYEHACNEFNSRLQAASEEQIEKLNDLHKQEMYEKEKEYKQELQQQEERYDKEIENKVSQEVRLRLVDYEAKSRNEKALMNKEHEQELRRKDEEINAIKLQNTEYIEEMISEAVKRNDEAHRLREVEHNLHISRIERENEKMQKENEKMQKILENVPPEFRGTAGELKLFEDLHEAFQQDVFVPKKVGAEMPDVIQTVTTDRGNRIDTPIIWDMKTGKKITPRDIEKAKKYKEIYNTDYCILVTANGITTKDSKGFRTGLIGEREGVLLVNPKMVIAVAELTRRFVIERTRLIKNSSGRESKQIRLYEYMTSSARFRKVQERIDKKLKLDELQTREEERTKRMWNERKNLVQDWFDLDREDQEIIDSMTEKEELDGEGNTSDDDEGDDVS